MDNRVPVDGFYNGTFPSVKGEVDTIVSVGGMTYVGGVKY